MRIFISNQTNVMPYIVLEAYQELFSKDDTSHLALDDFVLTDGSCSSAGFGKNIWIRMADFHLTFVIIVSYSLTVAIFQFYRDLGAQCGFC